MHTIVRLCLGLFGAVAASGFVSAPARAEYVTAGTLNCRSAPSAQAPLIAKLSSGQSVTVLSRQASWSKIETASTPQCWASSRFLSETATSSFFSGGNAARATRKRSTAASAARPSRSAAARSSRGSSRQSARRSRGGPRSYGVSGGSCPCSGGNVCIGPRGGRYCITSGGNKRYGV